MNQAKLNRKRAVWGVIIIAAGVLLLLLKLDAIDWRDWRPLWPAIPVVIGVSCIAAAEKGRQVASGVSLVLVGLWLFACTHHWYGLTYRTGWPLLLVVGGLEMVLTAVFDRLGPAKEARHA